MYVLDGEMMTGVSCVDAEVLAVLDGEILDDDMAFVIEVDESSPVERDVCSIDDDSVAGVGFDGDGVVCCSTVFDDHFFVVGSLFDEEGVSGGEGVGGFGEGEPGVGFCSWVIVISILGNIIDVGWVCRDRGNGNCCSYQDNC